MAAEIKWNCLNCGNRNVHTLEDRKEDVTYSITSVTLGVAEIMHSLNLKCVDCNQEHIFQAPKTRINMHYFKVGEDDNASNN